MTDNSRGSEWRRWDLHVHSPESFLRSQKPDWNKFIVALESAPEEIKAIAITDYGTIDGYKKVKAEKDSGRLKNIDLILPNVELRIAGPQASQTSNKGIDIHFIFDNSNKDHVTNIERCLRGLKYEDSGSEYECNKDGFKRLGETLSPNDNKNPLSEEEAIKKGFCNFRPNIDQFRSWVESEDFLKNHCLIAVDKNGISKAHSYSGYTSSYNKILEFAHLIFSGSPDDRYYWLGKKGDTPVGGIKPCIHGCDKHKIDELFQVENDRFCWIKADTTFEGLKQIIREPKDRIFIGDKPLKLLQAESNKTKYINSLSIKKASDARIADTWFDNDLELNSGLIAIIGNKGSGKSALADILALSGNSHCNRGAYSFLKKDKFLTSGFAENFWAKITWLDGNSSQEKKLNEECDLQSPEKVKYIPQSHLEKICAEPNEESFQKELEDVLYSRLDETEKRGSEDFKSLMESRTFPHKEKIDALRRQVKKANEKIIALEAEKSEENVARVKQALSEKQRELGAHRQSKPNQTADEKAQKHAARLDENIEKLTDVNEKINTVSNLMGRITNFKESYIRLKNETEEDFNLIGLKIEKVVKFEFNEKPLQSKLNTLGKEKQKLIKSIEEYRKTIGKLAQVQQQISAWNTKLAKIEAEGENLRKRLSYIEKDLQPDLDEEREKRSKLVQNIVSEFLEIIKDQESLYASVGEQVRNNETIRGKFQFDFSNKITEKDFAEKFLNFLNRNRSGTYQGEEEGQNRLQEKMAHVDFHDKKSVNEFLLKIDGSLHKNERNDKKDRVTVASQLRKGVEQQDLYDYIWSLEYLKTKFAFTLDGKSIEKLSPGERGMLLLFFYLLMDDRDIPIIIDQPEENLDNQTIHSLLAPIIKEAKKKRQVIMVTHNPNIAVFCDAEQVIHASIAKSKRNEVTYESGAIESPEINKELIDVLEGTRPAFDNRDAKYFAR